MAENTDGAANAAPFSHVQTIHSSAARVHSSAARASLSHIEALQKLIETSGHVLLRLEQRHVAEKAANLRMMPSMFMAVIAFIRNERTERLSERAIILLAHFRRNPSTVGRKLVHMPEQLPGEGLVPQFLRE
ncbi:MAG: hypothetical protein WBA44_02610 [Mesorhizobium sp.]